MLSKAFLKTLHTRAQQLNPVIWIGVKGLTKTVHQEIDQALMAHELIKIRVNAGSKEQRETLINDIVAQQRANIVQKIGHIAVLYRANEDED